MTDSRTLRERQRGRQPNRVPFPPPRVHDPAYLDRWLETFRAEDDELAQVLDQLQRDGCNLPNLALWTCILRNAGHLEWLSRDEVRRMAADARNVANQLERLRNSVENFFLKPHPNLAQLPTELRRVAEALDRIVPGIRHGSTRRERFVIDWIAECVQKDTGRPHDREVRLICSFAQSGDLARPIAVRQRRQRRKKRSGSTTQS